MSGHIVYEVLERAPRDLPTSHLLVLIVLAERAYDGDRVAPKSRARIVQQSRLAPSTVSRALADLVQRGLIVRRYGYTGRGQVQAYYIPPLP